MEPIVEIEITGPDAGWLIQFTRILVEDCLAASGTIIEGARSICVQDGELEEVPETIVRLRTRQTLISEILHRAEVAYNHVIPGCRITSIDASAHYHRWVLERTELAQRPGRP